MVLAPLFCPTLLCCPPFFCSYFNCEGVSKRINIGFNPQRIILLATKVLLPREDNPSGTLGMHWVPPPNSHSSTVHLPTSYVPPMHWPIGNWPTKAAFTTIPTNWWKQQKSTASMHWHAASMHWHISSSFVRCVVYKKSRNMRAKWKTILVRFMCFFFHNKKKNIFILPSKQLRITYLLVTLQSCIVNRNIFVGIFLFLSSSCFLFFLSSFYYYLESRSLDQGCFIFWHWMMLGLILLTNYNPYNETKHYQHQHAD